MRRVYLSTMAVKFCYSLNVLLGDLKRCGYSTDVIEKYEVGDRALTAKIRVSDKTAVNWDRHSLTVWAEGPTRSVRRIERSLKLRGHGGLLRRLARKRIALVVSVIMFLAVACFVAFESKNAPSNAESIRTDISRRAH